MPDREWVVKPVAADGARSTCPFMDGHACLARVRPPLLYRRPLLHDVLVLWPLNALTEYALRSRAAWLMCWLGSFHCQPKRRSRPCSHGLTADGPMNQLLFLFYCLSFLSLDCDFQYVVNNPACTLFLEDMVVHCHPCTPSTAAVTNETFLPLKGNCQQHYGIDTPRIPQPHARSSSCRGSPGRVLEHTCEPWNLIPGLPLTSSLGSNPGGIFTHLERQLNHQQRHNSLSRLYRGLTL